MNQLLNRVNGYIQTDYSATAHKKLGNCVFEPFLLGISFRVFYATITPDIVFRGRLKFLHRQPCK
jgi:hypothetical protein